MKTRKKELKREQAANEIQEKYFDAPLFSEKVETSPPKSPKNKDEKCILLESEKVSASSPRMTIFTPREKNKFRRTVTGKLAVEKITNPLFDPAISLWAPPLILDNPYQKKSDVKLDTDKKLTSLKKV